MNDHELAKAVSNGELGAIQEFVDRFYPSVYRYAWVLCGNREDAEDLAQEALLKARIKAGSFRGEATLRSWVHSIAYREFLRWRRRHRLWPRLGHTAASREPGFQAVDDADELQRALARIPEGLRQAFVLSELCELPGNEVARVLGIPQGTVKSRAFHARKKLREILAPQTKENLDDTPILEY